jgi:hypothetical protein
MAYAGIAKGAKFTAANMEAALDTRVSATGNVTETISGAKTFTTSPVVPSKNATAGNNATAIATEAQVYKFLEDRKASIDAQLSSKVSLSGDETISGAKTFATSPVVPGKSSVITEINDMSNTAIATEAQVYKTLMCW